MKSEDKLLAILITACVVGGVGAVAAGLPAIALAAAAVGAIAWATAAQEDQQ